jgi:hypothetical protein
MLNSPKAAVLLLIFMPLSWVKLKRPAYWIFLTANCFRKESFNFSASSTSKRFLHSWITTGIVGEILLCSCMAVLSFQKKSHLTQNGISLSMGNTGLSGATKTLKA